VGRTAPLIPQAQVLAGGGQISVQQVLLRVMSIVAVVLAADQGEGFVQPKYLTMVQGTPLLEGVIHEAKQWPVDEVIVVLGSDGELIADGMNVNDMSIIIDPEWEEGGASPLRAALDLVSRDRSIDLVVLARGDQRGIGSDLVGSLIAAAREASADVVVPKYRYARGWPVVIAPALWSFFLGLEGPVDVHDVIKTHAQNVEELWIDHLAPPIIDNADDIPRSIR